MNKKIKQNKGITLIALIITIIIMLILVAVTVAVALQGGIFTHAQNAANKQTIATEKEEIQFAISEWKMEKYSGNSPDFVTFMNTKLSGKATAVSNGDNTYSITFSKTGNEYTVNENGNIDGPKVVTPGITISPTTLTVEPEGTGTLTATLTGGLSGTITWQSSDTSVVTVSGDGTTCTVTGITEGTATVIASIDGTEYARCTITVGENAESDLRKYILGADEKGITAFTEVDAENGIMSLFSFEFVDNSTINNASATLHYVTTAWDSNYKCIYFKYDEDGKYYKMTCDMKSYQTIDLVDVYTPSSSSNIGRTLTYGGKSYTVISENGTDLEVVANYLSDPVTLGASTYSDALTSFNSAISTLDSAAVTASGLSVDGTNVKSIRSIGNSGNSDNDSGYFANPDSTKFSAYTTSSAKASDLNYEVDLMKLHNAGALSASSDYWLASRVVTVSSRYLEFDVRYFDVSKPAVNTYVFCFVYNDGDADGSPNSYTVRPVISLSSSAPGITWNN